jgi:acyl carrier protein
MDNNTLVRSESMDQKEVFEKVVAILKPFAKNKDALASVALDTAIQKDLKVNSARLVDIVLEIEDIFGIQVKDEDAEKVRTIGDAVNLILSQRANA